MGKGEITSMKLYRDVRIMFTLTPGNKVLRPNQINANVVTWTRLLSREATGIVAGDTPSSSERGSRPSHKNKPPVLSIAEGSPPRSTSHSGESSPKTPDTPSSWHESSGGSDDTKHLEDVNGGSHPLPVPLPPPEPMSLADLSTVPDQIILPPPPQFVEENKMQQRMGDRYSANRSSKSAGNREQNQVMSPSKGNALIASNDKHAVNYPGVHSPNGVTTRDVPPPLPPPPSSSTRRQSDSSVLPDMVRPSTSRRSPAPSVCYRIILLVCLFLHFFKSLILFTFSISLLSFM